jgi:hypothetical protein
MTHRPGWQTEANRGHLENVENAFKRIIPRYLKYFENAPIEFISRVYLEERAKLSNGIENELFGVWLDRMLLQGAAAA